LEDNVVKEKLKSTSGFTLIELLVVIIVIGVLSAIALLAVGNANRSANLTACKTDVQTVASALQGWKNDYLGYTIPGTSTNPTFGNLVEKGYLSSQILSDPQKAYSLSLSFTGSSAQIQISGNGGTGTGSFDIENASASVDAQCRKALGM
jgi:prepilin-type N-terminal cleavage/methylation domain-containing protein